MASKPKFQISRSLDERIKTLVINADNGESEFSEIRSAYILGFNYLSTNNYIGLTTNYKIHNAGLAVVGLAFFKSSPTEEEIKTILEPVLEYSNLLDGLSSLEPDHNLFLIYSACGDDNNLEKKVFDLHTGAFLSEKVKLSVVDAKKIYAHSCLIKLCISLNLKSRGSKDGMHEEIDEIREYFSKNTKKATAHLLNSNFAISINDADQRPIESLYEYIDPQNDILQMGDYLPHMTNSDKIKLIDKWRNKIKMQRAPLEFELKHPGISANEGEPGGCYNMRLEQFFHLQVNDSISKSMQIILIHVRQRLDIVRSILTMRADIPLEPEELKACTFKPPFVDHFIPAIYAIPSERDPDYDKLLELRRELHLAYLVPTSRPQFRYSQRVLNLDLLSSDEQSGYLCNIHRGIQENSGIKNGLRNLIQGSYTYHHYMQDQISDNGWGCAYRSLQTIISWFKHQGYIYSPDVAVRGSNLKSAGVKTNSLRHKLNKESRVPTHDEIQTVLVDVGDKQPSFIGSQKWIGSQEVCYVLSHLYDLDSKFISVSSGSELVDKARDLGEHFATQSTPIMIGGGVLAHTIIGVDFNEKSGDISYLILDPHYTGSEDLAVIIKKGWCGWKKNAFWDKGAFYNLCLPQVPVEI